MKSPRRVANGGTLGIPNGYRSEVLGRDYGECLRFGLSHSEKSHSSRSMRSWDRLVTPYFIMARCRRTLTVSGEIWRRFPISRFVYPKQASAATSCSRALRDCHRFHSLSFETYWVRSAARISGSNSSSGRPSCWASVLRDTCRGAVTSYFRRPGSERKPI